MSFGRELLLSCIVMMQISLTGSQQADFEKIRKHMMKFELPLCNLLLAEKAYIKYMFDGHLPVEFKTNASAPLEGITVPVRNDFGEVVTFISTITDCLDTVLPEIIRNFTLKGHHQHIINNSKLFLDEFKEVQRTNRRQNTTAVPVRCPAQITDCNGYCIKRNGLRIICYAKQWVERFVSCKI